MEKYPELYFENETEWYGWLLKNHALSEGVYLIFYKLELNVPTMRWEEAVKVALCFGWIDSTVKSLGNGKRRQYFTPRNPKSVWSALNKHYIKSLKADNLIHSSGLKVIELAKSNGSWTALDDVENEIIPDDLQKAFCNNPKALKNYNKFAPSYRKSYLYWLNQAKRESTRNKRIMEIIDLCVKNIKSRGSY
ncbi:YdeI/OmpD-associated family protein [Aestuariivivens sediminis]|uniref:YdeI/OmpD-associated family protein n=1 Tax=Aestuariivivens sediminis TaxID=2913557 RepID=UPI001F57DD5A|nr:YdeI/OmpD-associated family protein [Aestuariivivens sediminis]